MSLVTVARFVDPPTAHLARGLLEANGIQAFVFNEHYVGMDWLHSQAIGGVELRVAREQALQALALIADPPRIPEPIFDVPDPAAVIRSSCPACGATDFRSDRLDHRLRALSLALGVPLAAGRFRYRCGACGHGWRALPPHRGLRARLADGVALVLALLAVVLALPLRLLRAGLGLEPGPRLECWACGTPFRQGDVTCAACGVVHPPLVAFEHVIELGRPYDATCRGCHTPFVRAERGAGPCPVCGARSSG